MPFASPSAPVYQISGCSLGLPHAADLELIESLAAFDLPKQVLLAHGISAPDGIAEAVQMPPGSDEADLNELALALSDVVVYDADLGEKNKLVLLAKHLEKLTISLGQALPTFLSSAQHHKWAGPAISRLVAARAGLFRQVRTVHPRTVRF